ncbi:MAG: PIN domain-containing protein [Pigmentiphaga sp.]|uniref:PIN domain-containing protein n=1 Tax=Pigmentiphaga sp. TaxID=1977564 RepID=UPI0029B35333|nr:PIN domain-containing protein [Pigmentiphaga sp.]MDX3904254.1 PIN domain-containing protein [Pigmentiphaga sp.]
MDSVGAEVEGLVPPLWLVLDACVLMSSILRPLLLEMAGQGWFRPVWSERIGLEWRRNAARIWGVAPPVLEAEWASMCRRFPDADAGDVSPYEVGLTYSDPKDRHVIAAGLASRARAALQVQPELRVLTWNLKDFNRSELRRQGLSVWDPDRQLAAWVAQDRAGLLAALAGVPAYARALGRDEPLAATLRRERLFRTGRLLAGDLDS